MGQSQAARDLGLVEERVSAACASAGFLLSVPQAAMLGHYLALLNRWNQVHSLTAIESPDEQVTKHILDSLAAWRDRKSVV